MRLKTYIVDNMSDAMLLIKKDLGLDALILNTKKVKTGGFLGFFKKEKIEVIAAAEVKPKEKPKELDSYRVASSKPVKEAVAVMERIEVKSEPVHIHSPIPQSEKKSTAPESLELMNELKNIKQFMMQVIQDDRLPEVLKPVHRQLMGQQLTSEILSEINAKLMLMIGQNPDYTSDQVKNLARKEIIEMINKHKKPLEEKNAEIICFIGPTGVGKTTTIAKIAADYMLREEKTVGLITSDTYRIAAVEQLRTYANILNIPIKVVESAKELTEAIHELSQCDIILMDTAGRNYQQKEYIEELEQLLPDKSKIQINLVLSLTSKYEDMRKIIDNFKTVDMDQLLLTKQDETSTYGSIVNLIHDYSIPIHYITNGQNVPNDILTVTPELIANFLLGEDAQ